MRSWQLGKRKPRMRQAYATATAARLVAGRRTFARWNYLVCLRVSSGEFGFPGIWPTRSPRRWAPAKPTRSVFAGPPCATAAALPCGPEQARSCVRDRPADSIRTRCGRGSRLDWQRQPEEIRRQMSGHEKAAPINPSPGPGFSEWRKTPIIIRQDPNEQTRLLRILLSNCPFDRGSLCLHTLSHSTCSSRGPKVGIGGESGIRTHGRVSPTHAFQACAFNHSAISPFRINHLRAVWNSVAQNPPSNPAAPRCDLDSAGYRRMPA